MMVDSHIVTLCPLRPILRSIVRRRAAPSRTTRDHLQRASEPMPRCFSDQWLGSTCREKSRSRIAPDRPSLMSFVTHVYPPPKFVIPNSQNGSLLFFGASLLPFS